MVALALSLSTLSLLAVAAHFLRRGDLLPCVAAVAVAGMLLLVRRPWALRLAQAVLALGVVVWCSTAFQLVLDRQARGEPAARPIAIFAAVIALDVAAFVLLGRSRVAGRYHVGE
jgi:hypothetical protein